MTEFKVGDKVKRISGSHNRMCVGDLDIIRYVNSSTSMDLKHHGNGHMPESFELVTDKEKTKMTEKDIKKFDKKALGEAVKDIDEERLDQQKDKAKDILREIYSRKDTTEESKEKVSEELKGINKELNDFTKASK